MDRRQYHFYIRLSRQLTRYVPHARQLIRQIRDAERRRRGSTFASTRNNNSRNVQLLQPLAVNMESRRPLRIVQNTPQSLTEEQALELLGRDIIGILQKLKLLNSRTVFLAILAKNSEVFLPSVKSIESKERCSICLSDFEPSSSLRKLKCEHTFHLVCIDRWLLIYLTCPLCRRGILGNKFEVIEMLFEDSHPAGAPMVILERIGGDVARDDPESMSTFLQDMISVAHEYSSTIEAGEPAARGSDSEASDSEVPDMKRPRCATGFDDGAGPSGYCGRSDLAANSSQLGEREGETNHRLVPETRLAEGANASEEAGPSGVSHHSAVPCCPSNCCICFPRSPSNMGIHMVSIPSADPQPITSSSDSDLEELFFPNNSRTVEEQNNSVEIADNACKPVDDCNEDAIVSDTES